MKKQDETVSSGANGSGAISSNMSMKEEACAFLGEDGRCQIHAFRPGLCRLFPLGRQYHDGGFSYFVLPAACPGKTRTKVRISSYLDVPELPAYEAFLLSWHDFLAKLRKKFSDTEAADFKEKCMVLLKVFYLLPYDGTKDFYLQYRRRLKKAETLLLV